MKKLLIVFPALTLLLTACIPSLHPLYTKETLAFRENLVGTWKDQDDAVWTFEKGEDQSYLLTVNPEDEKQESYQVHLVRLNDLLFIDFYPKDHDDQPYSLTWMVPTHSFGRIDFLDKEHFRVRFFDNDWLETLFEQRKIRIKHERLENGTIVLTAGPEELQQFVIKYADESRAFLDPFELNRQP